MRAKTIDLLGSDSDKEEFFKEFELFDHLRALYTSKRRYRDLFNLCVFVGDLPSALDAALSGNLDDTGEVKTIGSVSHYMMAEAVFSRRGLIETEVKQCDDLLKSFKSPYLTKIASQWEKAFQIVDLLDDEDAPVSISSLDDELVKGFLCLFVSLYLPFSVCS